MLNKFKGLLESLCYGQVMIIEEPIIDLKNCHNSFSYLIFKKPFLFLFLDPFRLVLGPSF